MCIVLNGSTQYVSAASAPVTAYPFTFFGYFNPTVTNVAQYVLHEDNSASTIVNGWRVRAAGDVGGPPCRLTVGDGTSTGAASTATNFSAATWQKTMLVGTNASSLDVYLNNGGVGSNAGGLTPTGLNRALIGATELLAVLSGFFNGSLAHVAIWSKALGTQSRAMLQAGYSPRLVEIPNLVAYLPFWNSAFGVTDIGSLATSWTAQASPTYGADPGIKYNNNSMTMGMT